MIQICRRGWWIALLAAAGCTKSADTIDPQVLAAHRERLVLAEEPDGAVSIVEVREMLVGPSDAALSDGTHAEDDSEGGSAGVTQVAQERPVAPESVVVVGRIGGVPNPWKGSQPDYPWSSRQAQFVIADPAAAAEIADHGHAHDDPDHECPFCASAAGSDVVAVVRFKGEDGEILRIDARELFGLKGEETVVVRARPTMLGDAEDGVLMLDADALYVRR